MLTTTQVKNILTEKIWNKDYRVSNNYTTVEIQNAHMICDKDYIVEPSQIEEFSMQWYIDNYEPLVFGKRNGDQFNNLINELEKDNASRRAVITMIDKFEYYHPFICTEGMQVFLNDNSIKYIVNMRSSDAMRFPNDILWHKRISKIIAYRLANDLNKELMIEPIEWNAGSLHIYEQDFDKLLKN